MCNGFVVPLDEFVVQLPSGLGMATRPGHPMD